MVQIKLSGFYFFYFALLGVMAPYLGLYLEARGFNLLEISQLTSILMVTKVIAPNIWGAIADKYQHRILLVRLGALLTLLSYVAFFFSELFWHYALVIVLFSFFWNAILPQFEVLTLHNLGADRARYSQIRLWGSVGFIVAVVCLGALFETFSIRYFPVALIVIIFGILCCSFFRFDEPAKTGVTATRRQDFKQQLARPAVIIFFIVCFLLQLSHGAYYTYYSIYLETLGHSKTYIGVLWGLGVLSEVVLFVYMHLWLKRSTLESIMLFALLLTALRWLIIALWAHNEVCLVLGQLLHAMSFGAMHAAAIGFVHQFFSAESQGRAQALYSSIGFGLGGATGAALSGWMLQFYDYDKIFILSSITAATAALLIALFAQAFQKLRWAR